MILSTLMGIPRLGTVALLLSLLSFTLPVQIVLAQGYLGITAVHAPESVIVGQVITMSVSVEWSSLHTYAWGNPVYVRAEICEGIDLANCNPLAFAPSVDGEPIRDESGITGSTNYSFSIHAPERAMLWHLIAIFEVAAMRTGATENAVWRGDAVWLGYHWAAPSPNAGHYSWREFDILVKPSENALLTSQTLFADGFESGLVGWQVEGIASTVDKDPVLSFPNLLEGHSGRFAALLGIDTSGGTLKVNPKEAGLAYSFSLRREIAVTPGSDLTVTFWYRGRYPYVTTGPLPNMFLTYSVDSTVGKLDEVTFHEEDWLPPAWRSVTRSMSVPTQVSTVTLLFYGRGEISPAGVAGAIELDDVLVTESTFSVSTTALSSTTTSQTEIKSSSTVASSSIVETVSGAPPQQMTFLEMNWPYVVAGLVVLAIVGVLLVRKRKAPGMPTAETKRGETTPEKVEVYCFYCGAPMPTDAKFCRECGKAQKPVKGQ
jgi:hypothetical protein